MPKDADSKPKDIHKPQPTPAPATGVQQGAEIATLPTSLTAAGNTMAQASRLADTRIPVIQRQAMAGQMANMHGNQHMVRVMRSMQGKAAPNNGHKAQSNGVEAKGMEVESGDLDSGLGGVSGQPVGTSAPPTDNHGVGKYTVQAKMTVNAPNDVYEQEADHVADTVMRQSEDEIEPIEQFSGIQAKEEAGEVPETTPEIEANISSLQGRGQPLPEEDRSFFEARMGQDFSQVRVHNDNLAVQTSQDLNAKAFTVGNNVAFNSGEYQPGTESGRHLLAHELTHVVQQGGAQPMVARKETESAETAVSDADISPEVQPALAQVETTKDNELKEEHPESPISAEQVQPVEAKQQPVTDNTNNDVKPESINPAPPQDESIQTETPIIEAQPNEVELTQPKSEDNTSSVDIANNEVDTSIKVEPTHEAVDFGSLSTQNELAVPEIKLDETETEPVHLDLESNKSLTEAVTAVFAQEEAQLAEPVAAPPTIEPIQTELPPASQGEMTTVEVAQPEAVTLPQLADVELPVVNEIPLPSSDTISTENEVRANPVAQVVEVAEPQPIVNVPPTTTAPPALPASASENTPQEVPTAEVKPHQAPETASPVEPSTPIEESVPEQVQTKLMVNAPGDVYEQEADSVANAVMRHETPAPIQRQTTGVQRFANPLDWAKQVLSQLEGNAHGKEGDLTNQGKNDGKPLIDEEKTKGTTLKTEQLTKTAEIQTEQLTKGTEIQTEQQTKTAEIQTEQLTKGTEIQTEQLTKTAEIQTERETKTAEIQTEQQTKTAEIQTERETKTAELQGEQVAIQTQLQSEAESKATEIQTEQQSKQTEVEQARTSVDTELQGDLTSLQGETQTTTTSIQTEVNTGLQSLQDEAQGVATNLQQQATTYQQQAQAQITTITQQADQLKQTLQTQVSGGSAEAKAAAQEKWDAFVAQNQPVLQQIEQAGQAIKAQAEPMFTPIQQKGQALLTNANTLAETAWTTLQTGWTTLQGKATGLIDGLKEIANSAWQAVQDTARASWEGLKNTAVTAWTGFRETASAAWTGLQNTATSAWTGLQETSTAAWNGLKESVTSAWVGLQETGTAAWTGLQNTATSAWTALQETGTAAWQGLQNTATSAWMGLKDTGTSAWQGLQDTGNSVTTAFNGVVSAASQDIRGGGGGIMKWFGGVVNSLASGVLSVGQTAWNGLSNTASSAWNGLKNTATSAWTGLKETGTAAWTGLQNTATSAWTGLKETGTAAWTGLQNTATSAWTGLKETGTTAWTGLQNTATSAWIGLKETGTAAWTGLQNTASTAVTSVQQMGETAWSGLQNFGQVTWRNVQAFGQEVTNAAQWVWDGAKTGFNMFVDGLKWAWEGIKTGAGLVYDKLCEWGQLALDKINEWGRKITQFVTDLRDYLVSQGDQYTKDTIDDLLPEDKPNQEEIVGIEVKEGITIPAEELGLPGSVYIEAGSEIMVTRDNDGNYIVNIDAISGAGFQPINTEIKGGLVGNTKLEFKFDPNKPGDMTSMAILLGKTGSSYFTSHVAPSLSPFVSLAFDGVAIAGGVSYADNLQKVQVNGGIAGSIEGNLGKSIYGEISGEATVGTGFEKNDKGEINPFTSTHFSLGAEGELSILKGGLTGEVELVEKHNPPSTELTISFEGKFGPDFANELAKIGISVQDVNLSMNKSGKIEIKVETEELAKHVLECYDKNTGKLNLKPIKDNSTIETTFTETTGRSVGGEFEDPTHGLGIEGELEYYKGTKKSLSVEGPWYGNYAGPGNNGTDKKPVDPFDTAARDHDKAYEKVGGGTLGGLSNPQTAEADLKLSRESIKSLGKNANWKGEASALFATGVFGTLGTTKTIINQFNKPNKESSQKQNSSSSQQDIPTPVPTPVPTPTPEQEEQYDL